MGAILFNVPTPPPYTGSPLAWYDISQEPVLADGAEMFGMTDQSGNGNHIVFPDGTRTEPLYASGDSYPNVTAWYNDIRQPGAVSAVTTPLAIPGFVKPCTIFIAWKKGDWSIHGPHIDGYNPFTMCFQEHKTAGAGHYEMVGNGVSAASGVGDMNFAVLPKGHWGTFLTTLVFNGANSSMQLDQNAAITGLDTGTADPGGITLGMYGDQSNYAIKNFFLEILVYNNVEDVAANQAYLMSKWGI